VVVVSVLVSGVEGGVDVFSSKKVEFSVVFVTSAWGAIEVGA
jgi:hypothetical protein